MRIAALGSPPKSGDDLRPARVAPPTVGSFRGTGRVRIVAAASSPLVESDQSGSLRR